MRLILTSRTLALSALALALAAPAARASDPADAIQTAGATNDDTMAQIQQWIAASKPVDLSGEAGADGVVSAESPRKVHGEAGVSVGTGGYSSVYAAGLFPVGKTGTLGLAVSETRMGSAGRYRGPGFGSGTYKSMALSLALGDASTDASACGPYGYSAYRDGYDPTAFGPGRGWGDPAAGALARTACREALKDAVDPRGDDLRD
ncbi:hypothetical protein [Phenylobacterium sp.]|uniref:hypothetical protein n=1 Tax=Phenylobacterium sp. TaxID=1871053 RepID=UPI0035B19938